MIEYRHRWLLRNLESCFDSVPSTDGRFGCRLCRVQEKGEVRVTLAELGRHLAAHQREKVAPKATNPDEFLEATS